MNLPDNIFRSGVPHAVETNLVTRHAINPRHAFLDTDPAAQQGASDPSGDLSPKAAGDLGSPAPVIPGAHLRDNVQALEKHGHSDNWQSLGQDHLQDNRQAVEDDVFNDNYQNLGPASSIQEQKLYLEKKSIKDHRLQVSEHHVTRAAPQMGKSEPLTSVASTAVPALSSRSVVADKTHAPAEVSAARQQEDDALRARMKKLKATVRDVKDTLSDLDPPP